MTINCQNHKTTFCTMFGKGWGWGVLALTVGQQTHGLELVQSFNCL